MSRIGIGMWIPGVFTNSAASRGFVGLVAADQSQSTGSYVVGDTVSFTATTIDNDGHTTTGVDLYESGVLIGAMVKGQTGTWTYTIAAITSGAKSYLARRAFVGNHKDSSPVAFTVRGSLAPNQITTATLIEWFREPESFVIDATPRKGGTSPPAVTWSGNLTGGDVGFLVTVHTAGGVGVATVDIKDGEGNLLESNVSTAAGTHAILATGVNIVFPASGTYSANNTFQTVCNPIKAIVVPTTNDLIPSSSPDRRPIIVNPIELLFDAAASAAKSTAAAFNNLFGGANHAFYVIMRVSCTTLPTGANQQTLFIASHSTDANLPFVEVGLLASQWLITRRATATDAIQQLSSALPGTGSNVIEAGFDGTNARVSVNGADVIGGVSDVAPAPINTTGALTLDQFCLGARLLQSAFSNFFNGRISDVAFFDHIPSALEREQLLRYY